MNSKHDSPNDLAIAELAVKHLMFADGYYRRKTGEPTPEPASIRLTLRRSISTYGSLPAIEFGPRAMKTFRDKMKRRRFDPWPT